eukprot:3784268-Heterocapsa_arctica.AAC.1
MNGSGCVHGGAQLELLPLAQACAHVCARAHASVSSRTSGASPLRIPSHDAQSPAIFRARHLGIGSVS